MHWHWQNLKDADGPRSSRDLVYGRAWLHLGPDYGPRSRVVNPSWRISRVWDGFRFMLTVGGDEDDCTISVGFGCIHLSLTFSGFCDYDTLPRGWGRQTGCYLFEDHFVVRWNYDDSEWSSRTGPKHGWGKSWFRKDVLLGRAECTHGEGETCGAVIQMPESAYLCTVQIADSRWDRPRWPFPLKITRATVEIPGGLPIPGRGENSWDSREDAIYSSTFPAKSVAEAVEHVRADAEKTRLKRGGENWRPERVA